MALVLSSAALATLSIQSVRREAEAARVLLEQTHRSVADLVTVRFDRHLQSVEAKLAGRLERSTSWEELIDELRGIEREHPEQRPVVLIGADGSVVWPPRGRRPAFAGPDTSTGDESSGDGGFRRAMAEAERLELRDGRPADAARRYAAAADLAPDGASRTSALNGQARCEFKVGRIESAMATYERLIREVSDIEPDQAERALIAFDQLIAAASRRETGPKPGSALDGVAPLLLRFWEALNRHRLTVDGGLYRFYRGRLERTLGSLPSGTLPAVRVAELRAEELYLDEAAALLRALDVQGPGGPATVEATTAEDRTRVTRWPDSEVYLTLTSVEWAPTSGAHGRELPLPLWLAHRDDTERLASLLRETERNGERWPDLRFELIERSDPANDPPRGMTLAGSAPASLPGFRIAVAPVSGTLESLASGEVRRYAALLVLVSLTLAAGLALAVRSAARELALARLRSEFVSSVSHELKTPLALIRVYAENLDGGRVDDEKKGEYYQVIRRESERLTNLINNVLEVSRIEDGTRHYEPTDVDLTALTGAIVDRYRSHFRRAGIDFTAELPQQPIIARVDGNSIEQVIVNLLSNAAKYIGEDERRVATRLTRANGAAVLEVADTGIGIAPHERSRIFERYGRGDHQIVRSVPGSGIGLTIAKHIVDAHGGTIDLESEPGVGTTFRVTLPLRGPDAAIGTNTEAPG